MSRPELIDSPRILLPEKLPRPVSTAVADFSNLLLNVDRTILLAGGEGGFHLLRATEDLRHSLRESAGIPGGILHGAPLPLVHELVDGIMMDLVLLRHRDLAQLTQVMEKLGGPPMQLLARFHGVPDEHLKETRILGGALQGIECLTELPAMLRRGRHYLPLREFHECDVQEDALFQANPTPELRALVQRLAQHWRGVLDASPKISLNAEGADLYDRLVQRADAALTHLAQNDHNTLAAPRPRGVSGLIARLRGRR